MAIGVISPGAKWNLKGSQKPTRWTRTFFDVWVAVEYCDLILWNVLSDWLLVFVMAFVGSSCLQPEVELSLVKWAFIISYICYFGCLLSLPYHADNTFKNFNILSDVALRTLLQTFVIQIKMSDSRRRSTRRVKKRSASYDVNDLVQVGCQSVCSLPC